MFSLYRSIIIHLCIPGATECLLEFYYLHYFPPNNPKITKTMVAIKTHIFPLILFVGKLQEFLSNLVAPHGADRSLIHLNIIREKYLDQ